MTSFEKIKNQFWLVNKYGIHYFTKRIFYTIKKKIHLRPGHVKISSSEDEKLSNLFSGVGNAAFFISGRETIAAPKVSDQALKTTVEHIFTGTYPYFQSLHFKTDVQNKWFFNPHSGYIYSKTTHWSKINDFSSKEGDIKFVWELSRFCYLYDIIRYDHHFSKDSSVFVFGEIENWIISNSPNMGPNYMSGQEIALRLLNWIYALHFYSASEILETPFYQKLTNSIYSQAKHIDQELYFSKSFVRNNHLLSESLALFTVGLLFPQFKESSSWLKKGYSIFCKEIIFQFDSDGAYLQHSFNYQRVAMQLCTWFLQLCKTNKILIGEIINKRLIKSVDFMLTFIGNERTGELPNFGNNDGSLFFPLNNEPHTNYYPQLQALASALNYKVTEHTYEDVFWFNLKNEEKKIIEKTSGIYNFNEEGYYVVKEENSLTFLWCPQLKNRPSQADMLHLDIWYNGENLIRDNGTYLYNTSDVNRNLFFGSRSHNTIQYDGNDLMKKGKRFIFYNWPKKIYGNVKFVQDSFIFKAEIIIFPKAGSKLNISRKTIKKKDHAEWEITDTLKNTSNRSWTQIWNISDSFLINFNMFVVDENNVSVKPIIEESFTAIDYGFKISSKQLQFSTETNSLKTIITKK